MQATCAKRPPGFGQQSAHNGHGARQGATSSVVLKLRTGSWQRTVTNTVQENFLAAPGCLLLPGRASQALQSRRSKPEYRQLAQRTSSQVLYIKVNTAARSCPRFFCSCCTEGHCGHSSCRWTASALARPATAPAKDRYLGLTSTPSGEGIHGTNIADLVIVVMLLASRRHFTSLASLCTFRDASATHGQRPCCQVTQQLALDQPCPHAAGTDHSLTAADSRGSHACVWGPARCHSLAAQPCQNAVDEWQAPGQQGHLYTADLVPSQVCTLLLCSSKTAKTDKPPVWPQIACALEKQEVAVCNRLVHCLACGVCSSSIARPDSNCRRCRPMALSLSSMVDRAERMAVSWELVRRRLSCTPQGCGEACRHFT